MLLNESKWINSTIKNLIPQEGDVIINIGSQTKKFIEDGQPNIFWDIIQPLENCGCRVVNVDLQTGPGIEICGDINSAEVKNKIKILKPRIVLACNILEHVHSIDDTIKSLIEVLDNDVFLIVTCPTKYPYHPDPIDNGFRPTSADLNKLFHKLTVVVSGDVECENSLNELNRGKFGLVGRMGRLLVPFINLNGWIATVRRLPYIIKRYRVACACYRG